MTAPVLRSAVATASAAGTSYAVTAPTMVDGDMLVIGLAFPAAVPTITPPAGFTAVTAATGSFGTSAGVATFTKPIATASSEPATYTFTFSTSKTCIGIAASASGAKTNHTDGWYTQAFSNAILFNKVTTPAPNPLVLAFAAWNSAAEDPPTVTTGWSSPVSRHGTTGTAAFTSKGATQAAGALSPTGTLTGAGGSSNVSAAGVVLYDATANIVPTVTCPKGVESVAGAAVTITATASDPDGTVASYLWEVVSDNGALVTLTNATTATVTVTPASANAVETVGLRCTVTDNAGGTNQAFSAVTMLPSATSWATGI